MPSSHAPGGQTRRARPNRVRRLDPAVKATCQLIMRKYWRLQALDRPRPFNVSYYGQRKYIFNRSGQLHVRPACEYVEVSTARIQTLEIHETVPNDATVLVVE